MKEINLLICSSFTVSNQNYNDRTRTTLIKLNMCCTLKKLELQNLDTRTDKVLKIKPTENMSHLMTKPTKWHVRPAKTQISLGIRLRCRMKFGSLATHWVHSKDSDQTGRMPRLIWVFVGRTVILLVLLWCSSYGICTQDWICTLDCRQALDRVLCVVASQDKTEFVSAKFVFG